MMIEIKSQPWKVNIINNDLSNQLMKLIEQIGKLYMQGNSTIPSQCI